MPKPSLLDAILNVVLIGDTNTGKSAALFQYTDQGFRLDHDPTTVIELGSGVETISVGDLINRNVKLKISDTAGMEPFRSITSIYYKHANAVLLFCDVTQSTTFNNLSSWLTDIKSHDSTMPVFLVANKCDLETQRVVSAEELAKWARENGTLGLDGQNSYTEISAKTADNVEALFKAVAMNGYRYAVEKILDNILVQKDPSDALAEHGVTVAPSFLASFSSHQSTASTEPAIPTINEYITIRTGETGIQGTYSKEQKIAAARWVSELSTLINVGEYPDKHYSSQEFANKFLEHRGPLCQGGESRLTKVFQNMLYPSNGTSPIFKNEVALNILRLYFAIGLLEEFKRQRNTFSAKCRYLLSELFGEADSKAKSAAVDAIVEVLSGNSRFGITALPAIKNIHRHALGERDGLTKLLNRIETTFGCFSDEMQTLALSLEHLRPKKDEAVLNIASGLSP